MKNKRLLCGLICAVLLICLAAPALAEWGTVSGTSTLNVRSGPGKNYSRTGTVRKGEWVQALYDYGDFVYAYIPSQDLYGYLSGKPVDWHSDMAHFYTRAGAEGLTHKVTDAIDAVLGIRAGKVDFDAWFDETDCYEGGQWLRRRWKATEAFDTQQKLGV